MATTTYNEAGVTYDASLLYLGYDQVRPLVWHLNRLAGGLVNNLPTMAPALAANTWAGTSGKTLVGALNAKAGITNPSAFLDLVGVLNLLAGTTGYAVDAAAALIPG